MNSCARKPAERGRGSTRNRNPHLDYDEFGSATPLIEHATRIFSGLKFWISSHRPLPIGTGSWYWDPTRIIPPANGEAGPITEFPFFTFLYADLHAHMMTMPLTLLFLGLIFGWIRSYGRGLLSFKLRNDDSASDNPASIVQRLRSSLADLLPAALAFGLLSLALGVLYPANTWDYYTYLVIGIGAILIAVYERAGRRLTGISVTSVLLSLVALVVLSRLLFQPYFANYDTRYSSVELWEGSKSPIWAYLSIHALPLFVLVTWMITEYVGWFHSLNVRSRLTLLVSIPALLAVTWLVGKVMADKGYLVSVVALPLIGLALVLLLRPQIKPEQRVLAALLAYSLGLTLMVEIIVLKGDISRMNTVFKFYLPVWIMLGVAAGTAAAWLFVRSRSWLPGLRPLWIGGFSILVAACALYPIIAGEAKIRDRFSEQDRPHTLDGIAYMPQASYADKGTTFSLNDDYKAITWMQRNIPGSPVILEAQSGEHYHWTGRVSINTGLPAVIGWGWHQIQQRSAMPGGTVEKRQQDVDLMYTTRDLNQVWKMIQQYNVSYIYVGPVERIFYSPSGGLAKFDQLEQQGKLRVVYEQQGDPRQSASRVTIYEVAKEAPSVQGN